MKMVPLYCGGTEKAHNEVREKKMVTRLEKKECKGMVRGEAGVTGRAVCEELSRLSHNLVLHFILEVS